MKIEKPSNQISDAGPIYPEKSKDKPSLKFEEVHPAVANANGGEKKPRVHFKVSMTRFFRKEEKSNLFLEKRSEILRSVKANHPNLNKKDIDDETPPININDRIDVLNRGLHELSHTYNIDDQDLINNKLQSILAGFAMEIESLNTEPEQKKALAEALFNGILSEIKSFSQISEDLPRKEALIRKLGDSLNQAAYSHIKVHIEAFQKNISILTRP